MSTFSGGSVFRGLVAGVLGAWVMDRVTWVVLDNQPRGAVQQEKAARPEGLDVPHLMVYRVAKALGQRAKRTQPSTAGILTHYLLGIGPALIYSALRERDLRFSADRGLLYGLTVFVLWDELGSVAVGVAAPARAYPWQAHLRGLIGHLSLGLATHVALTALETDFDIRPLRERHRGA
jgi:uncharacterized membrane protein YagU involved in acid resistance